MYLNHRSKHLQFWSHNCFCSTTRTLLSNFIIILYPESFIRCNRAVYNGVSLEVYTPSDFNPTTKTVPLSILFITYLILVDKQTFFENYHHQNNFYQENNMSSTFAFSLFNLALLLIQLLLLIFQVWFKSYFLRD